MTFEEKRQIIEKYALERQKKIFLESKWCGPLIQEDDFWEEEQ